MKLAFPNIQNVVELKDGLVSSLVIEHPSLLFQLLLDLRQQLEGKSGKAILSKDNVPISIPKSIELITDFIGLDSTPKRLLSKILQTLERTAQREDYFHETNQIISQLEEFLDKLAYEEDVELAYEKLSLANLLKAVGIRIIMDYNSLEEWLYTYMDLVTRFEGEKLFILVNLRSFLSDDAMETFLRTTTTHGMKILLVDSHAYPMLSLENRLLIDKDLCEI